MLVLEFKYFLNNLLSEFKYSLTELDLDVNVYMAQSTFFLVTMGCAHMPR